MIIPNYFPYTGSFDTLPQHNHVALYSRINNLVLVSNINLDPQDPKVCRIKLIIFEMYGVTSYINF